MLGRASLRELASSCAIFFALVISSLPAFGQELRPNGEPDPQTIRNAEDITLRAHQSYTNAISVKCLDVNVRDGLVALLYRAYWQIYDWERANRSKLPEKDSFYAEGLARQILDDYERLRRKEPCPQEAFPPTVETASKLQPPTGTSTPGAPGTSAIKPPCNDPRSGLPEGDQAQYDYTIVQDQIAVLKEEKVKATERRDEANKKLGLLSKLKAGKMTRDAVIDEWPGDVSEATFDPKKEEADANFERDRAESDIQQIDIKGDPLIRESIRLRKKIRDLGKKVPGTGPQEGSQYDDETGACPSTGLYGGLEIVKNFGRVRSREFLASTDRETNRFLDTGDPLGVGFTLGYNIRFWRNNIVVGPFASFDFLDQTINHAFAGGTFIGTTTHWAATAGVKAGFMARPSILLYGLVGSSLLNHDLMIRFGGATASRSATTPGFTAGVGGEVQLNGLGNLSIPMSAFFEYQHTWWQTATFNRPFSSPSFNYSFSRQDDTAKLGLRVYFGQDAAKKEVEALSSH